MAPVRSPPAMPVKGGEAPAARTSPPATGGGTARIAAAVRWPEAGAAVPTLPPRMMLTPAVAAVLPEGAALRICGPPPTGKVARTVGLRSTGGSAPTVAAFPSADFTAASPAAGAGGAAAVWTGGAAAGEIVGEAATPGLTVAWVVAAA